MTNEQAIRALHYVRESFALDVDSYEALNMAIEALSIDIVRCKECKYFEYDHVENVDGIPLIVAHEICTRWSDGVKTSENGYCFLGERGEADDE